MGEQTMKSPLPFIAHSITNFLMRNNCSWYFAKFCPSMQNLCLPWVLLIVYLTNMFSMVWMNLFGDELGVLTFQNTPLYINLNRSTTWDRKSVFWKVMFGLDLWIFGSSCGVVVWNWAWKCHVTMHTKTHTITKNKTLHASWPIWFKIVI